MTDPAAVRAAFEQLVELGPSARETQLAALAPDVAREVRELLDLDAPAEHDAWFEPARVQAFLADPAGSDLVGQVLGPFELVRWIGAGGMGAVYEARQASPERRVAVKVLHLALSSPERRARFEHEIQTLAGLSHPHVAALHAAGVARLGDGAGVLELPYFAMEFVERARPVTEFARELDLAARLDLFCDLGAGVEHAHRRGVLHRDLKPANLLVDAEGRAVVIDFGIARAAGQCNATRTGQLVGSLASLAPEQLEGDPSRVDVRVDVYGLGTVLYELFTGRAPFDVGSSSIARLAREVQERDAPAPTSVDRRLPREADWITARALAKDPERRYPSVRALVDDVRRLRAGEAVEAAPPSLAYRFAKRVRRNPLAAALLGLLALSLSGGAVATGVQLDRALRAERSARANLEELRVETDNLRELAAFLDGLVSAPDPRGLGRDVRVIDLLDQAREGLGEGRLAAPQEAILRNALAEADLALGRFALAIDDAGRAAELAGDSIRPWARRERARALQALAAARLEQGRPQAGLEAARALARELGARDAPVADFLVARALLMLGRLDETRALLDASRATWLEPEAQGSLGVGSLANLEARLLLREGDAEMSLEAARAGLEARVSALGPRSAASITLAVDVLAAELELGLSEASLPRFDAEFAGWRAMYGPEHPLVLRSASFYAEALYRAGRGPEAFELLRELAELDPSDAAEHVRLLNNLGGLHVREGEPEAALAMFDAAIVRLERDTPWLAATDLNVFTNRFGVLSGLGRLDEALAAGERAVAVELSKHAVREHFVAHLRRAVATTRMGLEHWAAAEVEFAALIETDAFADDPTTLSHVRWNRTYCAIELGDAERALELAELDLLALAEAGAAEPDLAVHRQRRDALRSGLGR